MKFLDTLFRKKEVVEGDTVDLIERFYISKELAYDGVATMYYRIYSHKEEKVVGAIDLRLTVAGDNYYYGHVGYHVDEPYRGNGYAYHACRVLFGVAKEKFGMKELLITCSPENIASYKTLVKLGGELIETVEVPEYHELYSRNEKTKCVFRYEL